MDTLQCTMLEEMKLNDYLKRNTVYLDCEIGREEQVLFCRQLEKLAKKELKKPKSKQDSVIVKISSFGGMVLSIFSIISYMEYWQEKGLVIETYCDGYTASGGSKILMAGTKGHRNMTRYGMVLIHQSNTHRSGSSTLQEDLKDVENSLRDWETIKSIMRKHSKLTEEDMDNFLNMNIDFVYSPKECLEKGIVDNII